MNRLSQASLKDLPKHIITPHYERSQIKTGIVHIGVGHFHRAHQAVYVDNALNRGETQWGISGISLRSSTMSEALSPQDFLYTLKTQDNLRIIGAIKNIAIEKNAALAALSSEITRIVSLTITEKAYTTDQSSAVALIHEALVARRTLGLKPFTLLSCDNLSNNGAILKRLLITYAQDVKSGIAQYIENEVASPCSMVDRIVPQSTEALRSAVAQELHVIDASPVQTETYSQWVLQDQFPQGRPRFEESGVEFVSDVIPYERMKLRLLNGAHTALALLGTCLGYKTVAQAMADPDLKRFIQSLWAESSATLPKSMDLASYAQKLTQRFEDTSLQHQLAQIATDTSQKLPQRIISPTIELLEQGKMPKALILTLAAWIYCAQHEKIADPKLSEAIERPDFENLLHHQAVFGASLPRHANFILALRTAYELITQNNCRTALKHAAQYVWP